MPGLVRRHAAPSRAWRFLLCTVLFIVAFAPARSSQARRRRRVLVAGRLAEAIVLPESGEGYRVPPMWAARGLSWGTRPLVGLIERAAARVASEVPGSMLWVGDLSAHDGGPTAWHRSHQNGRDADLIFFARDDQGEPAPMPWAMRRFDESGFSWTAGADGVPIRLEFDVERNWALVRALLEDEQATITHLFIAVPLKRQLLDYAREQGEPEELIARAEEALQQPGDSTPHNDHLHVRIAQSPGDGGTFLHLVARGGKKRGHSRAGGRQVSRPGCPPGKTCRRSRA
jgi:penicillin-insensitive murein endopeptidase